MIVSVSAEHRIAMDAMMAHIRQASLTEGDSDRSGQKRSKKNAAPKMVATNTPAKML